MSKTYKVRVAIENYDKTTGTLMLKIEELPRPDREARNAILIAVLAALAAIGSALVIATL